MNRFRRHQAPSGLPAPSKRKPQPLSEQRYQDLLKKASEFFESADVTTDDERQATIDEIIKLMSRHGLTANDLK